MISNYIGPDQFGRYLRNSGCPIANAGQHNTILGNRFLPIRH